MSPHVWECCGDPFGGLGCATPGCTHDPEDWPENATMHASPESTWATAPLADFLLTRIAEDERLTGVHGPASANTWKIEQVDDSRSYYLLAMHEARVRAECDAKRRIVELARDAEEHTSADLPKQYMRATLRQLAAVYTDHPEFRDEWRTP